MFGFNTRPPNENQSRTFELPESKKIRTTDKTIPSSSPEMPEQTTYLNHLQSSVSKIVGLFIELRSEHDILIDNARLAAQIDPVKTFLNIKQYNIDITQEAGQKALIEIAKQAVKKDPYLVSQHIQNYGINAGTEIGQNGLIEIAMAGAKKNPRSVSECIKNYKIDATTERGRQTLIEIAVQTANYNLMSFPQYLENYGINPSTETGQQTLIYIANQAAKENPMLTFMNIENFHINLKSEAGQKAAIDIALLAANQNPYKIFDYIMRQSYNECTIEHKKDAGQEALKEIAILAAKQNGKFVTENFVFFRFINHYSPKGQQALCEIARVAANTYPLDVYKNINRFEIDPKNEYGHQTIIDITLSAAKINGREVLKNIEKSKINSETEAGQKALIEIAEIIAATYPIDLCHRIKEFKIKANTDYGQQGLIKIAQAAAQKSGLAVCSTIQDFNINWKTEDGQQGLIKIAELAAANNGRSVFENLEKFQINTSSESGQKALLEIAKKASLSNPEFMYYHIGKFKITDKSALKTIFYNTIKDGISRSVHISAFSLIDTQKQPNFAYLTHSKNDKHKVKEKICAYYASLLSNWPFLQKQIDSINRLSDNVFEDDEHIIANIINTASSAGYLYVILQVMNIPPEAVSNEAEAILNLKNPLLRTSIIQFIGSFIPSELKQENLDEFRSSFPNLPALSRFYLYRLQEEGAKFEDIKSIESLLKNRFFKDIFKEMLLIENLINLVKSTIRIEKKIDLLKVVLQEVNASQSTQDLNVLLSIFNLDGDLKRVQFTKNHDQLNQKYFEAFKEKIPIPYVEDFTNVYESTFGKFRNPNALISYAGSLSKGTYSERCLTLPLLAKYMESVMNNTFKASRYTSSHLDRIFRLKPSLKEKWTEGAKKGLELENDATKSETAFDFKKALSQSIRDKHIEEETVPYLNQYLLEQNEEGALTGSDYSENFLIEALKKNKPVKGRENKEIEVLLLQKNLINVIKAKDKNQVLERLKTTLKYLPKFLEEKELKHDLERWISILTNTYVKAKELTLEDSDDACDLLLCGSEGISSCQRVEGDPYYNKCLLAYLLDGKNRLLVIKNADGAMKARAIIRLLWTRDQPVLFLERIYTANFDKRMEKAIIDFAKERARALDLPLVSYEIKSNESFREDIHSCGGPAPFEYVDSLGEIMHSPYWTIKNAYILQN